MNHKLKLGVAAALVAGATVAVSAFGITAANADPTPYPRTYVAVGSDTIQDLYNSFGNGYTDGGGSHAAIASISSYDATLPGFLDDDALGTHVTPQNTLAGTVTHEIGRPNGSGDGRKALSGAWDNSGAGIHHTFVQSVNYSDPTLTDTTTTYKVTPYSIDIARSSGKPGSPVVAPNIGGSTDQETFVPLARDAVAVATKGFTWNFTEPELQAIFGQPNSTVSPSSASGTYTQNPFGGVSVGDIQRPGGGSNDPQLVTATSPSLVTQTLHVKLPQSASGTRQFFQNAIGGTNSTVAAAWVNENNEENHANALTTTGDIIPFSAAQFVAQFNGTATDTGVKATGFNLDTLNLGTIAVPNNQAPVTFTGTAPNQVAHPGPLYGADLTTPPAPPSPVNTFDRDVYSVVPSIVIETTRTNGDQFVPPVSDSTYNSDIRTLVTSTLPGSANVGAFGFDPITYSATTADWIHSDWEH